MKTQCGNPQREVSNYFESSAPYWRQVYAGARLQSKIYRDRLNTTLKWFRKLGLPRGARILDVGCGAGLISVALSRDGYVVHAVDSTIAMLKLTREHASRERVTRNLRAHLGDVHGLPFAANTFDAAIAVGVIPWLHSEHIALQEMHRVLKPGGYLLMTADNNARLNRMLDPLSSPVFKLFRITVKRLMALCGSSLPSWGFQAKRHYPYEVNRLISNYDFDKVKSCTIGFGPFTVFGKQLFDESKGIQVHRTLQAASSRKGLFFLRWTGCHYLVLARKNSAASSFSGVSPQNDLAHATDNCS
jgi:ubiquinone/menaquinone biosynthesis C-methylase UbiE